MANIIVRTTLDVAKEYTDKTVTTKLHGKKHHVYFKVEVDDFNIEEALQIASKGSNIVVLDYVGTNDYILRVSDFKGVYITWCRELGMELSESDISHIEEITPEGVTPVIKLPEAYKNIRFVHDMSTKYKRVRFCGGTLYCFDDCRFGCCGRDILSKLDIKFDEEDRVHTGCCCALPVVEDVGLEFVATAKAVRKTSSGEKSKKTTKTTKTPKPSKYSSLLVRGSVDM